MTPPVVMHFAGGGTPTAVTAQIAASGDDCYARESSTFTNTSTSNWCGHVSASAFNYRSMMRFQLAVPQGAPIDSATMEQYSQGQIQDGGAVFPLATTVRAEAVDDAAQVVDYADFTSRESVLTTAAVGWDASTASGQWVSSAWRVSPDIKNVIQEVVNRPGWVSGGYINLWWGPTDPAYSVAQDITVQGTSYDDVPAEAAKLNVTYLA